VLGEASATGVSRLGVLVLVMPWPSPFVIFKLTPDDPQPPAIPHHSTLAVHGKEKVHAASSYHDLGFCALHSVNTDNATSHTVRKSKQRQTRKWRLMLIDQRLGELRLLFTHQVFLIRRRNKAGCQTECVLLVLAIVAKSE
jgi:hypothetical protein